MTDPITMQSGPPAGSRERGMMLWWRHGYRLGTLRADTVAGVTLAAYLLPAGIGDASLAGLPPQAGLYACMFSGLVFWLLCASRHTAITVTSAISLLLGTSLGALAGGDPTRHAALAAGTAILVSLLAFLAWLLKAGSLVSFVSETVLVGFKTGVALTLAGTQIPKLLGMSSPHGNFWASTHHIATHLNEINFVSASVGLAALAVLILGKMFLKNKPVALLVVVGGIVVSGMLGLSDRGVKVLGSVPSGLPSIGLPALQLSDANDLLPLALACFLLGAVETAAIGRMFAGKHGERLDANREFLALAGSNLASGLGHGFPVSGGMSQSLVNESSGARTPLSGAIAAGLLLVVALFFSGLLHDLPQPVLAAVVLMAVAGLVKVSVLRHLWKADRAEFLIAIAALAGVLISGLLRGVLIGAVISLLLLIHRASRPHVAFLGRIPGTRRYADMERHPDNEPVPGVVIFRTEGSLVYFNADHVHDTVATRVRTLSPRPHTVICDLSASPYVDLGGTDMLRALERDLHSMGIHLQIVEARSSVRDRLRAEGLEARTGRIDRFTSVADAVDSLVHEAPHAERPSG